MRQAAKWRTRQPLAPEGWGRPIKQRSMLRKPAGLRQVAQHRRGCRRDDQSPRDCSQLLGQHLGSEPAEDRRSRQGRMMAGPVAVVSTNKTGYRITEVVWIRSRCCRNRSAVEAMCRPVAMARSLGRPISSKISTNRGLIPPPKEAARFASHASLFDGGARLQYVASGLVAESHLSPPWR